MSKKEKIALPKGGRLVSSFITDVIKIFKTKARHKLFYRQDIKNIVKISKIKYDNINFIGFETLEPNSFITILEEYATPGYWNYDTKTSDFIFVKKSLSNQIARIVLESEEFKSSLLQISRIFYVPVPILYNNCLTLPKKEYDARFRSWTLNNSPEIKEMSLDESKKILDEIFKEFCFKDMQDKSNAIAGLLTPFLRGFYEDDGTRTPIFFYIGNRERVGKDYLAAITGIVYEGFALEEPPISDDNELRKKILSVFINGRKRFHSSNNKGFLNSSILESISTAKVWSDRLLGKNENLVFDNDLELSLSGNVGISYTPDLANRSIFIRLFLDIEDANAREFENPNLHGFIYKNRARILSALYTLIADWHKKDCPAGSVAFASYPEWAEICGGVMENAGYKNPCIRCESVLYEGDSETTEMKMFFDLCYSEFGDRIVKIEDLRTLAEMNEIFTYIDFNEMKGKKVFGMKIGKYMGRILNDIRLVEQNEKQQGAKKEVRFMKI